MQTLDAQAPLRLIDPAAGPAQRVRPSLRFVAGLSVSLILHGLLLWLLLMPRGAVGPETLDAVSTLLIEWQQSPTPRPQPRAPEPPAPVPPTSTAAATPSPTRADAPAVAVQEEPDAEFAPTAQRLAAAAEAGSQPERDDATPAAAAAAAAPSAADAYLWDVLAHLRRFQNYPERARQLDLEGTVWLRARVSRRGEVLRSEIERSSGHAVLDRAAAKLIAQASPLPVPPPGPYAITDLSLPVEYRLRRE